MVLGGGGIHPSIRVSLASARNNILEARAAFLLLLPCVVPGAGPFLPTKPLCFVPNSLNPALAQGFGGDGSSRLLPSAGKPAGKGLWELSWLRVSTEEALGAMGSSKSWGGGVPVPRRIL